MASRTVKIKPKLGTGIYTITEAAMYARVQPQLMTRWLFSKNPSRSAVITPQYGPQDHVVSFLDFVQTLMIRELRNRDVKMPRIREAMRHAKNKYHESYPFAKKGYAYLLDDKKGGNIVICPKNNAQFEVASGKDRGCNLFTFMALYLEKLDYDNVSGLASLYRIYEYRGITVSMNPHIRFGEPMMPSGYSAASLLNAFQVENTYEKAAEAYGVKAIEVETAHRFYNDFIWTSTRSLS